MEITRESGITNYPPLTQVDIENNRIASLPPFDRLQTTMINTLHKNYDNSYDSYLASYPKTEVGSFPDKRKEAEAYMADNLVVTPIVSAMVGGDEVLRVEMLNAVWGKITYLASMEGQMIAQRDAIKACTTIEELEAL